MTPLEENGTLRKCHLVRFQVTLRAPKKNVISIIYYSLFRVSGFEVQLFSLQKIQCVQFFFSFFGHSIGKYDFFVVF